MLTAVVEVEKNQKDPVSFGGMESTRLYRYLSQGAKAPDATPTHYYMRVDDELIAIAVKGTAAVPLMICKSKSGIFVPENTATITLKFT